MAFSVDVVVTSPDDLQLRMVVEVKGSVTAGRHELAQLKRYMLGMRATVGLLVTLDAVTILADTFRSDSEESVQEVARIQTRTIPELNAFAEGLSDEVAFQDAVQEWLVRLQERLGKGNTQGIDPILAEYVLPALAGGDIRAGGPRGMRRAAG